MVYSVQVKRPRKQDPLQALILRGSKRKRRDDDGDDLAPDSNFVFRLAHTLNSQQPGNDVVLESTPSSDLNRERKLHIVSSKRVKNSEPKSENENMKENMNENMNYNENEEIAPELQSMIAEYIQPQKGELGLKSNDLDAETEDYVYDVYFSEKAGLPAETEVGYIDISEKEEKLLFGDSDSDDSLLLEDEDDSNAEDYYKNDYPDEEDDALHSGSEASSYFGAKESNEAQEDIWSEDDTDATQASYNRYGWL